MKARMLTLVWGKKYVDWFERACVHSLERPDNLAALKEYVEGWDIATHPDDKDMVKDIASRLGIPIEFHLDQMAEGYGVALQKVLIEAMQRCLERKIGLLLAPPDTIFGECTIRTLCTLGQIPGLCISVAHPRVTPSILDIPWRDDTNAHLVAAAFRHPHRTWVEADARRLKTNTFAGGVSWKPIGNRMYAVTHMLPTVYYAQFHETDLAWWGAQTKVNVWDHAWPSKLVAEARHRLVGSSDAAMIVELTQEFGNIPPCTMADPLEPDKHWGRAAHNIFNKNGIIIFRAEEPTDA